MRKRRLTPREMRKMDLVSGALDDTGFAKVEVAIEAVVENLEVKQAVLAEWRRPCRARRLRVQHLDAPHHRDRARRAEPERVVGMHFFNPVHRMPLVEVIRGERTSAEAVATVHALATSSGKMPVVVRDAPGFLVNRILGALPQRGAAPARRRAAASRTSTRP